jgi:hypothetical protein
MPGKAQKEARKRRLARERMRRWRDNRPKPVNDDGLEPFDLPVYPPPVIVPQNASKYVPQKSQADKTADELPPLPPPTDPLLFDRASDKYRPAWVREMDPHPQPIRLTADPRAALWHRSIDGEGQTFVEGKDNALVYTVETGMTDPAAERAAALADAERRRGDFKAWKPGQTEEEQ